MQASLGVLIAVDAQQEWLLPWWWSNYIQENSLPITVVDLGMTADARAWCAMRAHVINSTVDISTIKQREAFDQEQIQKWEEIYGKEIWKARQAWFQKPQAMQMTPFDLTLWLDLDCEILGSLKPLFELLPNEAELGLVREPLIRQGDPALLLGEVLYNSGVVLYRKESSLIRKWAGEARNSNAIFWGDQLLLSRLIFAEKFSVCELPEIYNLQPTSGINPQAVIIHWIGSWGKEYIRKHGGLRKELFLYKINLIKFIV